MKTRWSPKVFFCLAILMFGVANELTATQQPIRPRWKWERGEDRRYRLELERRQTVEGEQEFKTALQMDAVLLFQPVRWEDDSTVIDLEFESLDIKRRAGELHYRFSSDSQSRRPEKPSVWELAGQELMENSLRLRQNPMGGVEILKGFNKPLATVLEGRRFSEQREIFQIVSLFGDEGLSRTLNRCLDVLPDPEIKYQEKWTKVEDADLQMNIGVRRKLEYLLREHSASNIVVEMNGTMELAEGERERVDLPGGNASVEIAGNSLTGDTLFSVEQGGILNQTHKGFVEIETVITEAGDDVEQRKIWAHLEQTIKLELLSPEEGEED